MDTNELADAIGPELARAITERGFTSLTPVQQAVLGAAHAGRDLRVSSQTGSGKTVALGLAIREEVRGDASPADGKGRPLALVLVPTRELAKQVHDELTWLFAPLGVKVASVTGGGGYRDELRSFRHGPAVVVGTPGRLRDHLERGSLDAGNVAAAVLDEADRMLDLGFRDEIEAILGFAPADKRVHLVSATFPREVKALADRVQQDPVHVMGTPLGAANLDIDHVVHLVHVRERLDAIVNLLLSDPGAQTLIFAHTRADVADLGAALADAGFVVGTLSGEMDQAERNRALSAFKRGNLDAMVATDVAARGIDVADVSRVIHADPPTDPDAYTHRSGRTGRAGRKGTSSVLVTPPSLVRTLRTLERARVKWRMVPIPTAKEILGARDAKLVAELTVEPAEGQGPDDARLSAVAEELLASGDPRRVVARLLARVERRGPEPRNVMPIAPPAERRREGFTRGGEAGFAPRGGERFEPRGGERFEPRGGEAGFAPRRAMTSGDPAFRPFRVSWGQTQGADARRLLATICRRGNIRGADVGAIRLAPSFSVVEVKAEVADAFERAAREPDPRAPRVTIRPWIDEAGASSPPPARVRPAARDRDGEPRDVRTVETTPETEVPAERPSRARRPTSESTRTTAEAAPAPPPERPSRARRVKTEEAETAVAPPPPERPSRARAPKEAPAAPARTRIFGTGARDVRPESAAPPRTRGQGAGPGHARSDAGTPSPGRYGTAASSERPARAQHDRDQRPTRAPGRDDRPTRPRDRDERPAPSRGHGASYGSPAPGGKRKSGPSAERPPRRRPR